MLKESQAGLQHQAHQRLESRTVHAGIHRDQPAAGRDGRQSSTTTGQSSKPYTLMESSTILMYLAEKTRQVYSHHDPVKRYDTLQWLVVQVANVGPIYRTGRALFQFTVPASSPSAAIAPRSTSSTTFTRERLDAPFVISNDYTIADIAAFPWLRNVELLGIDIAKYPHIKAWIDKLNARERRQAGLCQDRRHQVGARRRHRRRQGPLLRPR